MIKPIRPDNRERSEIKLFNRERSEKMTKPIEGSENKVELQFFDEFQYKLIDLTVVSNLKLESFLNSLGKEGWELIDKSDPYRAIFKRKLITV